METLSYKQNNFTANSAMHKAKLRKYIGIGLALLVLNVAEKRLFGFEVAFGHVKSAFSVYATTFQSSDTALFYLIAGFVFLWLATATLLLSESRILYIATAVIGLIFAAEIHQLSFLILRKSYYPGMVTGFLFSVLGVLVLLESYRGYRAQRGN